MIKRTWQPKKAKRSRKIGFLKKSTTRSGRKILAQRRAKGRAKIVTV